MTDIEKLVKAKTKGDNLIKMAEECAELIQAVCKYVVVRTPETRQGIVEEMVDVLICADIVRLVLEIDDGEFVDMRHHKMQRNLQRIGEEVDG